MSTLEEIRNERIKKLENLVSRGVNPYPIESTPTAPIVDIVSSFEEFKEKGEITVAGRVRGVRTHGGAAFFDLVDGSFRSSPDAPVPPVEEFEIKIQGYIKRDSVGEETFALFEESVDIGDFVEITGTLFLTKRQEKTLEASSWRMLAKSLLPLPDKWGGLQDTEMRFRKRYLDSLMSADVRRRFVVRARMIQEIRTFLETAGFLEIETPMLQPLAGGTTARPFKTHHNALDIDLDLRIAPEIYHKMMLVGGYPKVYEIGKSFRNEGIDVTHNPEFTEVEWYEAFSDAPRQRTFVEEMMRTIAQNVLGTTTLIYEGNTIDLGPKFQVLSYEDSLKRYALITNLDTISLQEVTLKANQFGVKVGPSDSREKILDNIHKKICRPKLVQPTFLVDYPMDYLPLAKKMPDNPKLVDAFQLVIGGVEFLKAFSELNDPIDQAARFAKEEVLREAGDDEAHPADKDFIEAMEYGMPPAGGVGFGIDRLAMLLTDTQNIREVIYFPTLKPQGPQSTDI